ncbi:MAG TPA: hypothetical protein VK153_00655 [Candidatus Paceibacterota bacterium]|nr:hypothetical protein [Candidatus Paceibacterota bacterium]
MLEVIEDTTAMLLVDQWILVSITLQIIITITIIITTITIITTTIMVITIDHIVIMHLKAIKIDTHLILISDITTEIIITTIITVVIIIMNTIIAVKVATGTVAKLKTIRKKQGFTSGSFEEKPCFFSFLLEVVYLL